MMARMGYKLGLAKHVVRWVLEKELREDFRGMGRAGVGCQASDNPAFTASHTFHTSTPKREEEEEEEEWPTLDGR